MLYHTLYNNTFSKLYNKKGLIAIFRDYKWDKIELSFLFVINILISKS